MEDKKLFLLNSALLYNKILDQTDNNCLKRFLAFKIIVNAMSFEDIVRDRQFPDIREVRNVFLAHKQNNMFSKAFLSAELIKRSTIDQLITFMNSHITHTSSIEYFEELIDAQKLKEIEDLAKKTLEIFEEEFYDGFRISNNFLSNGDGQIKEISSSNLAGSFYRFNSSKELSVLTNFFITNLISNPYFPNTLRNFKIDYILHSVNMKDCIFKDTQNSYSIDGLYEVITTTGIGNPAVLQPLLTDSPFQTKYAEMRYIRNKLAGHMDNREPLNNLLHMVDEFEISSAYDFVNKLDKAVYDTAQTHIAISTNYNSFNLKLVNSDIISIEGIKNCDYNS